MMRSSLRRFGLILVVVAGVAAPCGAGTRTVARCGAGFLEEVDGARVLHLKGSPYEMGYQHGAVLRDDIRELVRFLFDVKAREMTIAWGVLKLGPKALIAWIVEIECKHIPARSLDGMRGVADGAGIELRDILIASFVPERIRSELQPTGRRTR